MFPIMLNLRKWDLISVQDFAARLVRGIKTIRFRSEMNDTHVFEHES